MKQRSFNSCSELSFYDNIPVKINSSGLKQTSTSDWSLNLQIKDRLKSLKSSRYLSVLRQAQADRDTTVTTKDRIKNAKRELLSRINDIETRTPEVRCQTSMQPRVEMVASQAF
jgi:hypothetical protein